MKNLFPAYYLPSDDEFHDMFRNGIFVFDTSVLLQLYRYSESVRDRVFDILAKLSDQLWIPYQVAFEYHENRAETIIEQQVAYDEIIKSIADFRKSDGLNEFRNDIYRLNKRYPAIELMSILKKIDDVLGKKLKELEKYKNNHPNWMYDDPIQIRLIELLSDKVGVPFEDGRLVEIYKQGKYRYDREIPPGYMDKAEKSLDAERYGDLVIWLQMIEKAREIKKPIIFITRDEKKDWWKIVKNRTVGPRPELIGEMLREASVSYYQYKIEGFIERAEKYLSLRPEEVDSVIEEERELREYDRRAYVAQLADTARQFGATGLRPDMSALLPEPQRTLQEITQIALPNYSSSAQLADLIRQSGISNLASGLSPSVSGLFSDPQRTVQQIAQFALPNYNASAQLADLIRQSSIANLTTGLSPGVTGLFTGYNLALRDIALSSFDNPTYKPPIGDNTDDAQATDSLDENDSQTTGNE